MSEVSTITSSAASSDYSLPQLSESSALGKDAFLQLMVAELQNQDPLNPMDNTQYVTQLAQLTTMESLQNLDDSVGTTNSYMAFSAASSMLNKEITYYDTDGKTLLTGTVESVDIVSGVPMLTVNDTQIALGRVTKVNQVSTGDENESSS